MQSKLAEQHLIISGDVTGVGFRSFLRRKARELGLTGWVRNREDDAVEARVQGTRDQLDRFILAARTGPELSWVQHVSVSDVPVGPPIDGFTVLY